MTTPTTTAPILVIGGTGKTGRRVADLLEQRGAAVRSVSRSSTLPFDWEDPATWRPSLSGVKSVYLTFAPDIAMPGALEKVSAWVALAREAGVQHIVLLSGRGEEEAQAAEEVVQQSGVAWTILRCSWFQQNFSENFWLDSVLAGELALPAGDVGEPFVNADDIAEVAAAALLEPGHCGKLYELTGPRLLTFRQAVAEIAAATGREISYVHVPNKEYAGMLRAFDLPEEVVSLVTYLFDTVLDGRNAALTDGVQRALGRAPRDFRSYAAATAATGVWNPA